MPTIETLLLCNHAEAFNGLLYLSGAGWTDHHRVVPPAGPQPSHFGIALTILVPWSEANRRYHLRVWIEPEDGGEPIVQIEADQEQGRPPGVAPGSDLRAVLAMNADVAFPAAGGYRLAVDIDNGADRRSISFRVHDLQSPFAMPPSYAA